MVWSHVISCTPFAKIAAISVPRSTRLCMNAHAEQGALVHIAHHAKLSVCCCCLQAFDCVGLCASTPAQGAASSHRALPSGSSSFPRALKSGSASSQRALKPGSTSSQRALKSGSASSQRALKAGSTSPQRALKPGSNLSAHRASKPFKVSLTMTTSAALTRYGVCCCCCIT